MKRSNFSRSLRKKRKKTLVSEVSHPYIEELFDELKTLRTEFAREEGVPPYVVFSDATLVELATYLPQDESEMLKISGVGDVKMERYGADFLRVVRDYCESNGLKSRIKLKTPKRKKRTKRNKNGENTYTTSLKMFKEGMSVSEIASEREFGTKHDRKSSRQIYSDRRNSSLKTWLILKKSN